MKRRGDSHALLLGLALAVGLLQEVRAAEPVAGLRSLAMGDSLRGAATGDIGALTNPSGIALTREYVVTGSYGLRLIDPGQGGYGHGLHLSITDSVTQAKVAVGLYYNYVYETPRVAFTVLQGTGLRPTPVAAQIFTRSGHEIGLISAFPLGDRFIIGATAKYAYFSTTTQLPSSYTTGPNITQDLVYDMGSLGNVVSLDIGATIRLLNTLNLGVAGQNLWGHGSDMPTLLGMGLAYVPKGRLTVAADVVVNFTGYQECSARGQSGSCATYQNRIVVRAGGGFEYVIADKVPLRAGYLFDSDLTSHYVSGGLGYFSKQSRWGLDLGFRQRVSGGGETLLQVGFRVLRD